MALNTQKNKEPNSSSMVAVTLPSEFSNTKTKASIEKYSKILNTGSFENPFNSSLYQKSNNVQTSRDSLSLVPLKISEMLGSLKKSKLKETKVPFLNLNRLNKTVNNKETLTERLKKTSFTRQTEKSINTEKNFYQTSTFNKNLFIDSKKTNELLEKDKKNFSKNFKNDREVSYLHKDNIVNTSSSFRDKKNALLLEKNETKNLSFNSPFIPDQQLAASMYSKST